MALWLEQPAMRVFALTYLLLVLKMLAVGWVTSYYRLRKRVFATPEDYALQGLSPREVRDEDVERARRAHRNDLENILPFFAVGFFYALTQPNPAVARILFGGYLIARVLHSIFYLAALQPWRTLAFALGQAITVVMLLIAFARIW
ncbi:MAG: MAPEG family protein [Candidatus Binatia bacterium]|nr:MAPEG family protein [Candidatus Binatia bacterium]